MTDSFVPVLLKWFAGHGRDLPWRHTKDPYAIWLSEVILQQTRVAQGQAYWERFLMTFPTVEDLAAASEDEVLLLWQGLGYYSRARHLHDAAKQIVALGHFPCTVEELRSLSGVGDYTSAAVAAFAFGVPVAAIDGNVYRVLARHEGVAIPINSTEGKKFFEHLAQSLVPKDRPGDFNQAMMDFGATWCTPKSPHCSGCPFLETCVAYRTGKTEQLPVKLKKTKIMECHLSYVYIRCNGDVALHRRGPGIWQGLWEPFLFEGNTLPSFEGKWTLLKKGVRHVLTHRILHADFYLLDTKRKPVLPDGYRWIKESQLGQYALSRLVEILIEMKNES